MYAGDLVGPGGNIYSIWAHCKRALRECEDMSADEANTFFLEIFEPSHEMLYAEILDVIRDRFDWRDDTWSDDPYYSARAGEPATS
jgi:hypothetical protein